MFEEFLPSMETAAILLFDIDHEVNLSVTIPYLLQRCTLPDKRRLFHGMCLYQVMMTLHFLNDVANYADSTQNRSLRHIH